MNLFVSFESDEDNLAIEPAIRHTIDCCKEIPDGHEVKPFWGGKAYQQPVPLKNYGDYFTKPRAHRVTLGYCPRCFSKENWNPEYITSGGQVDGY